MKFKEQPKQRPDPHPAERDDVHVAANRCPFCHDDVAAQESVVCQECLARHHTACWSEANACSACTSEVKLQPAVGQRPNWVKTATSLAFVGAVAASLAFMNHEAFGVFEAILVVLLGTAVAVWGQAPPGSTRAWLKPKRAD